jgi:hypothetical protein
LTVPSDDEGDTDTKSVTREALKVYVAIATVLGFIVLKTAIALIESVAPFVPFTVKGAEYCVDSVLGVDPSVV